MPLSFSGSCGTMSSGTDRSNRLLSVGESEVARLTPNLGQYLNKTILVSIPALSQDERCRPYKLTGIELFGLWLEGIDLTSRFLPHEYKSVTSVTWATFVPFSQIACVAIPAASAASTPGSPQPAAQSQTTNQPATPADTDGPSSNKGAQTRKKPGVKNA